MSESRAKFRDSSETQTSGEEPSSGPAHLRQRPAGKVKHDARGTAIWDWGATTGVLSKTTSTGVLRMLDEPTLEIDGSPGPSAEWAGDPYNRGHAPR
jgi:hypothetical protein